MKAIKLALLSLLAIAIYGCVQTEPIPDPTTNPYTQGNVTLVLKNGVTTQSQVAEAFGAPNIVSQENGEQVWIYQKDNVTVQSTSGSAYATVIIAGISKNTEKYAQSSRTMTLIIHFNDAGIVSSFKSMSTSF